MPFLDGIAGELQRKFDAKNTARERSFQLSRAAIKSCSSAIRSVHRGQLDDAEKFTSEAHDILSSVRELLKDHPDVRYAGFFDDAEQEYAEARNVYSIIIKHEILTPEETGVEMVNYLSGLGDVTGELRRHILDLIRRGKPGEGEYYMEIMEEIFYLLMLFDYPDAITRGLRRKSDLARSMIERTRGDLTNAVEIEKVEASLRCLMDKLKESDFGV
jgi:translin